MASQHQPDGGDHIREPFSIQDLFRRVEIVEIDNAKMRLSIQQLFKDNEELLNENKTLGLRVTELESALRDSRLYSKDDYPSNADGAHPSPKETFFRTHRSSSFEAPSFNLHPDMHFSQYTTPPSGDTFHSPVVEERLQSSLPNEGVDFGDLNDNLVDPYKVEHAVPVPDEERLQSLLPDEGVCADDMSVGDHAIEVDFVDVNANFVDPSNVEHAAPVPDEDRLQSSLPDEGLGADDIIADDMSVVDPDIEVDIDVVNANLTDTEVAELVPDETSPPFSSKKKVVGKRKDGPFVVFDLKPSRKGKTKKTKYPSPSSMVKRIKSWGKKMKPPIHPEESSSTDEEQECVPCPLRAEENDSEQEAHSRHASPEQNDPFAGMEYFEIPYLQRDDVLVPRVADAEDDLSSLCPLYRYMRDDDMREKLESYFRDEDRRLIVWKNESVCIDGHSIADLLYNRRVSGSVIDYLISDFNDQEWDVTSSSWIIFGSKAHDALLKQDKDMIHNEIYKPLNVNSHYRQIEVMFLPFCVSGYWSALVISPDRIRFHLLTLVSDVIVFNEIESAAETLKERFCKEMVSYEGQRPNIKKVGNWMKPNVAIEWADVPTEDDQNSKDNLLNLCHFFKSFIEHGDFLSELNHRLMRKWQLKVAYGLLTEQPATIEEDKVVRDLRRENAYAFD